MPMPVVRRCEQCGGEVALGALAELCPQCLLWSAAQGSTTGEAGHALTAVDSTTIPRPSSGKSSRESDGEAPRVKGYVPIAPLGRGGMGVVCRALQVGTRREVA